MKTPARKQPPALTELQALVAGTVYGALMAQQHLKIDAEILLDGHGNYKPEVKVRGLVSGEQLLIRIDVVEEDG